MTSNMESFSLILNSQNATNLDNSSGEIASYKYYINWDSVLPTRRQTYNVSFTLKSVNTNVQLTANGFIDINFGQTNIMDQSNNPVTKIGICYPVVIQQNAAAWNYYYNSTIIDNTPVTISYPSNKLITVLFTDFNSATAFTMYHYVLQLIFTPID